MVCLLLETDTSTVPMCAMEHMCEPWTLLSPPYRHATYLLCSNRCVYVCVCTKETRKKKKRRKTQHGSHVDGTNPSNYNFQFVFFSSKISSCVQCTLSTLSKYYEPDHLFCTFHVIQISITSNWHTISSYNSTHTHTHTYVHRHGISHWISMHYALHAFLLLRHLTNLIKNMAP